ncbi:MAG: DNA mismatch repair endonuclease MutL [Dysgonamonadaceae bacterium]|nr:DNA mismatch repair endonuclease MutL [Dysgonamonadaceae bacterium]MDD4728911.1 DNA mismatch repair endonuclease MutL [Dysgonamonadaceae bacterium]
MSDIIHLLPDSIANQIAAGEVIQRPASVVKELVENAIDAKATHIQIIIKDAGRTTIQVIDNGKGMSGTDARMAFERHATSKIQQADDLFALTTMGFRGEALPSISAISQVEIKTRTSENELGSLIHISGSKLELQEPVSTIEGTCITVKNLFFNVPARRKFLKSNEVERRNILMEVERIALAHPDIEFTLYDNNVILLQLPPAVLRQRITQLIGKVIDQQLIEIDVDTTLVKIFGYITKPENAKKQRGNQFFFVNGRYMRHPYFHRAITVAFENLIQADYNPNYFIYFQVDPNSIDVNIHPTKTEVKFENEQAIWQILMVCIKESLGKFNAVPSIDFDTDDSIPIPVFDKDQKTQSPHVSINPNYNPFDQSSYKRPPKMDWETLYKDFEKGIDEDEDWESKASSLNFSTEQQEHLPEKEADIFLDYYQYKQKYIFTSVKSGLMIIDQHRAHVRILFDKYLKNIVQKKGFSQRMLFPEMIEFTTSEAAIIPIIKEDMEYLGFELSNLGGNTFAVQGVPSEIENPDAPKLIKSMIENIIETGLDVKSEIQEKLALSFAKSVAIKYGKHLSVEEITDIVNKLFACPTPNYTPDGKKIISVINDEEMDRKLK